MQHNVSASLERRRLELSYVTTHMRDLQGMVGMPFILVLLVYVAWAHEHAFRMTQCGLLCRMTELGSLLAGLLAAYFMEKRIHHWYRDNFGFVYEPEPQIETSSVLSILHVKPVPTPEQKVAARKRRFREQGWIGAMWIVSSIMDLTGRHFDLLLYGSVFLFWSAFLLLPRCFWDAPPVLSLQLRRALSVGMMAGLVAFTIAAAFAIITRWTLLYFGLSGAVILASYDHWLLLHLLPASSARREVSDE